MICSRGQEEKSSERMRWGRCRTRKEAYDTSLGRGGWKSHYRRRPRHRDGDDDIELKQTYTKNASIWSVRNIRYSWEEQKSPRHSVWPCLENLKGQPRPHAMSYQDHFGTSTKSDDDIIQNFNDSLNLGMQANSRRAPLPACDWLDTRSMPYVGMGQNRKSGGRVLPDGGKKWYIESQ